MASDILLYQADLVPVGADQKQHLELTRNLAQRFNQEYSPTFTIPEPYIPKLGARIMSLQNPKNKMSKSDSNQNNLIGLLDNEKEISNKIKRAVTDSGSTIIYKEGGAGIQNLINIYSSISGKDIPVIESLYNGKGYKKFKEDLAELVIERLRPIKDKYNNLMENKDYLEKILKNGSENAELRAKKTLQKVYRKIGFIPKFK